MSPAEIALLLEGLEEAIKIEPAIQSDLVAIFTKPNPTPDDWTALRVKVVSKKYSDYVPASDLPSSVAKTDVAIAPEPTPKPTLPAITAETDVVEAVADPIVATGADGSENVSDQAEPAAAASQPVVSQIIGDDETIVLNHK